MGIVVGSSHGYRDNRAGVFSLEQWIQGLQQNGFCAGVSSEIEASVFRFP